MVKKITIKKGWYRFAGLPTQYGWISSGYEPEGVGINRDALFENEELIVSVNGNDYKVNCKEAIDFIRRFKSHTTMPGGTKIGIISRSIMEKTSGS